MRLYRKVSVGRLYPVMGGGRLHILSESAAPRVPAQVLYCRVRVDQVKALTPELRRRVAGIAFDCGELALVDWAILWTQVDQCDVLRTNRRSLPRTDRAAKVQNAHLLKIRKTAEQEGPACVSEFGGERRRTGVVRNGCPKVYRARHDSRVLWTPRKFRIRQTEDPYHAD